MKTIFSLIAYILRKYDDVSFYIHQGMENKSRKHFSEISDTNNAEFNDIEKWLQNNPIEHINKKDEHG